MTFIVSESEKYKNYIIEDFNPFYPDINHSHLRGKENFWTEWKMKSSGVWCLFFKENQWHIKGFEGIIWLVSNTDQHQH